MRAIVGNGLSVKVKRADRSGTDEAGEAEDENDDEPARSVLFKCSHLSLTMKGTHQHVPMLRKTKNLETPAKTFVGEESKMSPAPGLN